MPDNTAASSSSAEKKNIPYRPKGFFRVLKGLTAQTAEVCGNTLSSVIFEQRRELLRDRTIGDAQWMAQLEADASEFGGIESCKKAHDKLIDLLEELQI